jgi:hypothetical protein
MMTVAGLFPVTGFGQLSASWAYNDVFGMSGICGKKIAGEQVHIPSAFMTWSYFNPKEVFYMGIVRAA